jgi:hypothetical protein
MQRVNLRPAEKDDRNRIDRMRRMGRTVLGIDHRLAIAVIGDDEEGTLPASDTFADLAERGIHRFDRNNGRFQASGVADHVGIGVVDDDQIMLAAAALSACSTEAAGMPLPSTIAA